LAVNRCGEGFIRRDERRRDRELIERLAAHAIALSVSASEGLARMICTSPRIARPGESAQALLCSTAREK
jgi:hypothetical protein